jgi:hypothetical protein
LVFSGFARHSRIVFCPRTRRVFSSVCNFLFLFLFWFVCCLGVFLCSVLQLAFLRFLLDVILGVFFRKGFEEEE